MIILSVGMPRAGSGWYYNLTNELMLASGAQDAHLIRQRYHLENILTEVNCNIGALTPRRLLAVLLPSLIGNSFVIKAHAAPTPFALWLIRRGLILPTYIYRDPRDAMLSAMENGQRARQRGQENAFSKLVDFDSALSFMTEYIHIGKAWMNCSQALHTRYEDLLTSYDEEAQKMISFLGVANLPEAAKIAQKYRPESPPSDQRGLHFSQGKIGRFRQKMTAEQQAILAEKFHTSLEQWDYPI